MSKVFIGPKLRQIRLKRKQTQAEMAAELGVSASYVNLLENNERSLSARVLMQLSSAYGIDWKELTSDEGSLRLADLRKVVQDPIFGDTKPDIQELRGAIDHAPTLVEMFLQLYRGHRDALQSLMQVSDRDGGTDLLRTAPETLIHDFFRDRSNHFPTLEAAAEEARRARPTNAEEIYATLSTTLLEDHGIKVQIHTIDEMEHALRIFDEEHRVVNLSQALDGPNRAFQLAHLLALQTHQDRLDEIVAESGFETLQEQTRLKVELANYFAAAYLMPYEAFLRVAENARYDIDRIATAFSASFEQVCQRLTTLQRDGARGIPFFFLRIDKAGNVSKRFNATSFNLAEYGGACPVWNIQSAFYMPGIVLPQFVEMPDEERFFTFSRTVHRPVFSAATQDRRLTLALGCEIEYAPRIRYATAFNIEDPELYSPIGITCHLCPRQACSQRAHPSMFTELPLDTNRRGSTRYES